MDTNQIVSRMNTYLNVAKGVLSEWLGSLLPQVSEDWWEECVVENLSYYQREKAKEKGYTKLIDFDLAALLRVANKSWYAMRGVAYLPTRERECIRDLMGVRNNWAHMSTSLPGKDTVLDDLAILYLFFEQWKCDQKLLNEIIDMIAQIKEPTGEKNEELCKDDSVNVDNTTDTWEEEKISEKDIVFLVGKPSVRGVVMSISDLGETKKYDVFVDGSLKTFYSGQIALVNEMTSYHWIDINSFRSRLAAYLINNPSSRDLYSLNSARIDFVPYQFRPALKLIHSDEPRILIADSVGVGKTIEAGLLIKELQARINLESVLIICPKPLVAERKWELEMKRFDEVFVPVNGPELRQIISDTDRDGTWPVRYNKAIIPYSVLDSRTYKGDEKKGRKGKAFGLVDLDPAPHFDLVIVDEAHHIRNGSLEKEKAFEYKCVKYFCDNADAVVMLTATPLQTSDNDLFTLLNVLRPDVVIDKPTFEMMSRPNAYISNCISAMRKAGGNWQQEAMDELKRVLETQWGENVIASNPVYTSMLQTLRKNSVSREERVRLITDAESLHSFYSMLNRTRRKDIQDFCIRRPYTLSVKFTLEQQELHDELLRFEQKALLQLHRSSRSIPFMMSTIKRQAASCIFGLAPHIQDMINRRFEQLNEDLDYEFLGFDFNRNDQNTLSSLASTVLDKANNLPKEDPKFALMLQVVKEKQKYDNNKIIIFSTFRYTLGYLRKKLIEEGFRVAQVDGSVKDIQRQAYRELFELSKDNPDAIDIMLFTEVGAEGLDYQFCNMIINYDLPWNPMKIEQRIGRIDRRGQKSESVNVYNMITEGTVDANIYYRCLLRIGVFERSIGDCDEILGDIATQIDRIALDVTLTEEERCRKLEQMADNEILKLQEINRLEEEEKEFFGLDLSEFTTTQEIQRAESPWLTQRNIQVMIERYLNERVGQGKYIIGENSVKQLRISAIAREELRVDLRKLSGSRNALKQSWDNYLKGKTPMHAVTFDAEAAEKNRDAFFITAMHPLARQAAAHFLFNEELYICLRYATKELPKGQFLFSVYAWSYVGINPHFRLMIVCDNDKVREKLPEIFQEARSVKASDKIDTREWDALEMEHVMLWKAEKVNALKEAQSSLTYKLESLTNNYRNLRHSLEQRIQDTPSENIRRMYRSELESATEGYEAKVAACRKQMEQTDIHTTLIANGILEVNQ